MGRVCGEERTRESSQLPWTSRLGLPACVPHPRVPAAPLLATLATSGAVTPISGDLVGSRVRRDGERTPPPQKGHTKATIAVAALFAAPAHRAGSNPAANNAPTTHNRPQLAVVQKGARASMERGDRVEAFRENYSKDLFARR